MKQYTPIKRHPSLVAMSADHHFGLLLAWKIEERTLFNHLQETLAPAALEQAAIQTKNRGPELEAQWDDEFWKKN